MDKKLKAKWVKALRSGEYKQGRSSYYSQHRDAYCCLGVLGSVITGEKGNPIDHIKDFSTLAFLNKTAGLETHQQDALVKLNDHQNKSFPEIADWIEANL